MTNKERIQKEIMKTLAKVLYKNNMKMVENDQYDGFDNYCGTDYSFEENVERNIFRLRFWVNIEIDHDFCKAVNSHIHKLMEAKSKS